MAQRDQILDSVAINEWLALLLHLSLCPRWTVSVHAKALWAWASIFGPEIPGCYYFGL